MQIRTYSIHDVDSFNVTLCTDNDTNPTESINYKYHIKPQMKNYSSSKVIVSREISLKSTARSDT